MDTCFSPAGRLDQTANRLQLRRLDACLQKLEDLHEQDQVTVPPGLATGLRPYVPAVQPGMLISDAIELVFERQETYLGPVLEGEVVDSAEPLAEAAARALTERIKTATHQVCLLLMEAHDRQAWSALGYQTWERYVRREFGLSRSRSYELLDQARVIRAVKSAAGVSGIPDISAYAALQIKPHLPEVLDAIRLRTVGVSGRKAMAVIEAVVRESRARRGGRLAQQRECPEGDEMLSECGQSPCAVDPLRLNAVIHYLATMPPVAEVLVHLDNGAGVPITDLEPALQWLTELAEIWEERRAAPDRTAV